MLEVSKLKIQLFYIPLKQRMQNKRRSQIKSQYYHRISNMQTVFSVKNVFKLETKNKTVIKLYI